MRILLATDGSSHSRSVLNLLTQTPFAKPGNEVGLLVVLPETKPPAGIALRKEGDRLARREARRLENAGLTVRTIVREGHVARRIFEAAEEFRAELVVVGSPGQSGARRFRVGQVSKETMTGAPCSVLVIRSPGEHVDAEGTEERTPTRILVALDDSESSWTVVEAVAALPLSDDIEITVATVLPLITCFRTDIIQTSGPEWHQRRKSALSNLESAACTLRRATPYVDTILRQGSDEAVELLTLAGELDASMIVLGHKGKSPIQRVFCGSVSARVTHRASCSVWVVRSPGQSSRRY